MTKLSGILTLVLSLGLIGFAQTIKKIPLVPGQPVEREIAGGESNTYQITLESGQFMRVLVEQKGIDLTLALATHRTKQERQPSRSISTASISNHSPTKHPLVVSTGLPSARWAPKRSREHIKPV